MATTLRALVLALLVWCPAPVAAEVLVRWDLTDIPPARALGISTVLVSGTDTTAVRQALAMGYAVFVDLRDAAVLANLPADRLAGAVVTGDASAETVRAAERRLTAPGARVLRAESRGKWPHVRVNWVTTRNDVLVVSSRTAQPWLENNGALVRIAQRGRPETVPLLVYPWQPITIADVHQGPARDNYLVAIAEAGTFGSHLVLPLAESFQRDLLLGKPSARESWDAIRRYIDFYSWNLPRFYRPLANIGVVTSDTVRDFELLNLLTRHNLPFELLDAEGLKRRSGPALDLLIVTDEPGGALVPVLADFARAGGAVVLGPSEGAARDFPWARERLLDETEERASYAVGNGRVLELRRPVADPNVFALQMREALGPSRRVVDIWNGITVLAAPYVSPDGDTILLPVLNYAHEPLPVQIRVKGAFTAVHLEQPGEGTVLIPFRERGGFTEFVLPELRIAGRVFLTRHAGSR